MARVRVEIGGRSYDIACRDGGEARLAEVARLVDGRVADVVRSVGPGNESQALVLAALLLADELDEARATEADLEQQAEALERCAARIEALADGSS